MIKFMLKFVFFFRLFMTSMLKSFMACWKNFKSFATNKMRTYSMYCQILSSMTDFFFLVVKANL